MMQVTQTQTKRRPATSLWGVLLVLGLGMPLFWGCAAGNSVQTPAVAQVDPEDAGYTVAQLQVGSKGFVISEFPQLDAAAREDFAKAIALLDGQHYTEAIALLNAVIEKSPGVTAPYINLAIAYQQVDKPELAEEHLNTALSLVPGHPVASNQYGLLYRRSGRFVEARAVYETALTHFPDYYPVHRNLGILCDLYLNDPVCALAHYEIYSRAKPEDRQIKLWIADLRTRLGEQ